MNPISTTKVDTSNNSDMHELHVSVSEMALDGDKPEDNPHKRHSHKLAEQYHVSTFKQQAQALRANLKKRHRFQISPRNNKYMPYWDVSTATALIFTALVTPVEVAILDTQFSDPLFWINRLVDMVFVVDMCMQFIMEYIDSEQRWVSDPSKIVKHYLRGWFVIDFVSVIPYDIVGLVLEEQDIASLKMVRLVRLLRLLKLARVLKASRIFQRWEAAISIRYSVVALITFVVLVLSIAHWIGCAWVLEAMLLSDFGWETWFDAKGLTTSSDPVLLYGVSIYWSLMTITGIGYGDVVPANIFEYYLCILCMIIGASTWGYIIGSSCAVLSSMDPHKVKFRHTMDEVNEFMRDRQLPQGMQRTIRQYFHRMLRIKKMIGTNKVMMEMSPAIKGDVAIRTNERWLTKVPYFNCSGVESSLLVQIALALEVQVFAPQEPVSAMELHIVHSGLVAHHGAILREGHIWGEDMVLHCRWLKWSERAVSLTFLQCLCLENHQFRHLMQRFPASQRVIRIAAIRMALTRAVIELANKRRHTVYSPAEMASYKYRTSRFRPAAMLNLSVHEEDADRNAWLENMDPANIGKPPLPSRLSSASSRGLPAPREITESNLGINFNATLRPPPTHREVADKRLQLPSSVRGGGMLMLMTGTKVEEAPPGAAAGELSDERSMEDMLCDIEASQGAIEADVSAMKVSMITMSQRLEDIMRHLQ